MTLLAPEKINITSLENVPFGATQGIPDLPGIYFISNHNHLLLYIGASRRLLLRLQHHNKRSEFEKHAAAKVYWLLTEPELDLMAYERACITHWRPLLNDGGPSPTPRGPVKRGYVNAHILLPPDLYDWAMTYAFSQGESFSALVRRLLCDARDRKRRDTATA